jgi:hypothetical protein
VANLVTATWLDLNSPPESPPNWEQINSNLNDHHCDPTKINKTFSIPYIAE